MSKRLDKIASFVENGIGVADVGTDHGYIPEMLCRRGYAGNIIGTDINEGPLNKARRSLAEAGFEDKVTLKLCDGLKGVEPDSVNTIIIAGMGGDTITGILDRAEWCAREDVRLILQPVTKPEILRYWLINNEFAITDEVMVKENGTVYQIICAKPGLSEKYSDAELFTGKLERISNDELFAENIALHIKRFKSAVSSLEKTERSGLEAWLGMLRNILSELEEIEIWQRLKIYSSF